MRHPAFRIALLAFVMALFAPALAAQTVRGRLTEGEGGPAVGGTLVLLVDASGATAARTLTDAAGAYTLQAPAPGRYRLRVSRVGFSETTSPEFAVDAGQTVERALFFTARRSALEALEVRSGGSRRCTPRPREAATAQVWSEARKALEASVVGEEQHGYAYAFTQYRRELDPRGTVLADERQERQARGRHPFASVPVESLVADGFAQSKPDGVYYYAPDARVLLSEPFLEGHCFHLQAAGDTLIGLAFEPVRGRDKTDVVGTLWLEPRSGALRHLEYRYVNLPARVDADGLGGRVEYERLPTGAFLVRRWWVRMPAVRREEEAGLSEGGHVAERRTREVLAGLREEGGEVVRVTGADGRDVLGVRHMAVRGTVYDSVAAAPLAGARVFLSGTVYAALTDSAGRFEITGVPEGDYTLSFNHPVLRELDVVPATAPMKLVVGRDGEASLAVPSLGTLAAARCPVGQGAVIGRVRDGAGEPVAGARVRASWGSAGGVEVQTDARGFYAACGIPAGERVALRAEAGTRRSLPAELTLAAAGPELRDLAVGTRAAGERTYQVAGISARARRTSAASTYISRADIERRQPRDFADILRGIPNVLVTSTERGAAVTIQNAMTSSSLTDVGQQTRVGAPVVVSGGIVSRGIEGQGNSNGNGGSIVKGGLPAADVESDGDLKAVEGITCPVQYYIDGSPVLIPDNVIGGQVHPDNVEAIEIFTRARAVPFQYRREGYQCGVILIWTRQGATR